MTEPRTFTVLLSHSNRPVDFDQCSREALTRRYADPRRLDRLPPFDALTALDTQRHFPAGLTILRLTLDGDRATLAPVAVFDPPKRKVQHAAIVGTHLVVCLEDALLVFDAADIGRLPATLDIAAARSIDDPWFAGLHTVFASGPDRCIVSASAPDAVLEVDLVTGCVVSRTLLPRSVYGHNYALDATDDLRRHYVSNDYQLAHVNCASPDGAGGVVLSTLIQGDIGHFDAVGRYHVVGRGHVGCHAARATADGSAFYFADSCNGALVLIDRADGTQRQYAVDSRWLHDVQQVAGDVFLFCIADRNTLALIDIGRDQVLLSERFDARGGATQFVSVAPYLPDAAATSADRATAERLAVDPFGRLRSKWREVPAGQDRYDTADLLAMSDADLVEFWQSRRRDATTGDAYRVRGWYHDLYSEAFRGRSVLDLGAGLGLDGITYAQAGARLTFADIVAENLAILRRLCGALGIAARFVHLPDLPALDALPGPFDAIYAQGSLIHLPSAIVRDEVQRLLRHLPVGGRWVELAYPRERWQRDGAPPFTEWGRNTDGAGTPWVEWCDLDKRLATLAPARFVPLLAFNFHGDDFNWFDLVRRG